MAKEGKENAASQIESLQRKLANAQTHFGKDYEEILAVDLNGVVFADSVGGRLKGLEVGDREYFKLAKQGKNNIGSVTKSKVTGTPIVQLAAPVISEKNEVVGVIVIVLKIDYLIDTIVQVKVGKTGYAFMVDRNGLVIAHPDRDLILKFDMSSAQGMEKLLKGILAGDTGVVDYGYAGVQKTAGYAPVKMTGWSVLASVPNDEVWTPIRAAQKQMALVALILLAVISGTVSIVGRRIFKPITMTVEGLSDAVDQVALAARPRWRYPASILPKGHRSRRLLSRRHLHLSRRCHL